MCRHNLSVEEICSIVFELKLPCLLARGIKCAVILLAPQTPGSRHFLASLGGHTEIQLILNLW